MQGVSWILSAAGFDSVVMVLGRTTPDDAEVLGWGFCSDILRVMQGNI